MCGLFTRLRFDEVALAASTDARDEVAHANLSERFGDVAAHVEQLLLDPAYLLICVCVAI